MLKKKKNNKSVKRVLWLEISVLLLLIISIVCIKFNRDERRSEAPEKKFPLVLEQGIQINKIDSYTGRYMEDGSEEVLNELLMIELENTSKQDLQIAVIQMNYGKEVAVFQVTNIPAGYKVIALEQNRMKYVESMPIQVSVENLAFTDTFSLCEEQLDITTFDGIINVKNISGKDINDIIYIYYKNYVDDMYYGGITYRVKIEGGIKAEEMRQLKASHFHAEGSRLVMVAIGG